MSIAKIDDAYCAYLTGLARQDAEQRHKWDNTREGRALWNAYTDAQTSAIDGGKRQRSSISAASVAERRHGRTTGPTMPRTGSCSTTPSGSYSARRFVAAVGQPYQPAVLIPSWRANLGERGFALHVPPDPLASIHYPGATLFVAVTLAGVSVKWLPDQDGRLADRWMARRAA
jgi:hypothetical protein